MATYKVIPKYIRVGAPLREYLGLSAAAIQQIKKRKGFPAPIRISQTLSYYKLSELDQWLESHRSENKE